MEQQVSWRKLNVLNFDNAQLQTEMKTIHFGRRAN